MADLSGIKTKPLLARVLPDKWHTMTMLFSSLETETKDMETKDGRIFEGQLIIVDIEFGSGIYEKETIPHWAKDGMMQLIATEHEFDDVPDELIVQYRREEDEEGLNSAAWQWAKKGRK